MLEPAAGGDGVGDDRLRFGVLVLPHVPWERFAEQCRLIEDLGFDSVWTCDHFVDPYQPEARWADGWALLAGLAVQTKRIRIGSLVTSVPLHNPATFARMTGTVDEMSGGRLEIGIGAGGAPLDLAMTGLPRMAKGERLGRFREFVEIVHRLLNGETVTREGGYYPVSGAVMNPRPVQQPRPPLSIGAEGPLALKIVADFADRWVSYGLHARSGVTDPRALAAHMRDRNLVLDDFCIERGRDPSSIKRCLLLGLTAEPALSSVGAFEETVGRYREAGVHEFVVYWMPEELAEQGFYRDKHERLASSAMLERVASDVIPRFGSKER
jgi:alkanesulfonate monooxygenase SsuD/methylene tetrahydromethanopterin reductase-like flavin-dependent oxidoreductase (luciferase family)